MERREALRNMAIMMGAAVSATTVAALFEGCGDSGKVDGKLAFNADQQNLVTEIADTIVPDTGTPGAKAAGVGPFITMMIAECYPDKAQKVFTDGLEDVEKRSKAKFSKGFVELSPEDRIAVLKEIADETVKLKKEDKAKEEAEKAKGETVVKSKGTTDTGKKLPYFFQLIRELTLLGYFTSETGATKALAYVAVPGRFDACTDLKPGQRAWAM